MLRELADAIARTLSTVFERPCSLAQVPEDGKGANVTPVSMVGKKENPGKYRPVSLTSVSGKLKEQNLLHNIFKHISDENVIGSSQHGIIQGKSCLTSLTDFYREVTSSVDNNRAVDVIYLDVVRLLTPSLMRSLLAS